MASASWAACEVEDVVDMVDSEIESLEIRKDCDKKVNDAGSCALSKVIRLAKDGKDADEIREECEDGVSGGGEVKQTRLYCCNGYGAKICPMVVMTAVGSVCHCQGVPGNGFVCQ